MNKITNEQNKTYKEIKLLFLMRTLLKIGKKPKNFAVDLNEKRESNIT